MSIEQWSDLMFPETEGTVTSRYGNVRAINDDGSYEVQLNKSSVTTRCAPCCTAMVGDRVLVLIKPNGKCDAIGRLGGEIGGGGSTVVTYDDVSNYIAGRVFAYAGTDEPIGALLCDGRAVSRREYWELFAAIGTTYGAGDGSSTFNLPNIESRTIIGEGTGASGTEYALGATGGEEKHKQTIDELALHDHDVAYKEPLNGSGTSGWRMSGTALGEYHYSWGGYTDKTGGTQPFNVMQPYIVMRYFITTGKGDPVSGINPADYVVEWGKTGEWTWRRYASGVAECWKLYAKKIATSADYLKVSGVDGMYYHSMATELPFTLNHSKIQATPRSGNNFVSVKATSDDSKNINITGYFTSNPPDNSIYVNLYATGHWKDSPASGGTESIAPTIEERFEKLEGDAPIASGTSGDWEWIKFANGLAICSFDYQGIHSSYAGPYAGGFYGYIGESDFPFAFVEPPTGSYAVTVDTGFTMPAASAKGITMNSNTRFRWYAFAWDNSGSKVCTVTGVIIGRWK